MRFSICAAKNRLALGALAGLLLLGAGSVRAETVMNASSRGLYSETGFHESVFDAYYAGWDFQEFRSFFVFDIEPLTETATGATITLWNPSAAYIGLDPSETFALWNVSTDVADLVANQEDAIAIFDDLGSGTQFGSIEISAADDGSYIVITLNAAAVSAINSLVGAGGAIAFGGSVTTLSETASEGVFDATYTQLPEQPNTGPTAARLTINPVPEPTTTALIAASVGVCLFFRRRRSC